ncbi:Phosphatidylinositol 4,5-bisphosphate 3-kinase catalytic subunit gamma isoform [Aphanomyces cochlioides]|nr:Phosphatidylinositol 4,5-bisphosphate 3-kinase catalytic subunit gamma isoform [Aphanomyces cochlioides]
MDICDDEPWHELCKAIVGGGMTFADGATSTLASIAITSSAILQSPYLDTTPTEIHVAIRDIVVAVLKSIMHLDIPLETHEDHLLQLDQTMAHLLSVVCNDETTEPTAPVTKTISALHSQLMNDAAFLFLDLQVLAMNMRLGQLTDLLRDVQRIDDGKIDQLMNVFEQTKTRLECQPKLLAAQVYFGKYREQQVAVKEFKVESSFQDAQALLQREVRVWKAISGEPFVLTLVGYCINAERPLLVCEYCPDTIKQHARYFPERRLRLVTELARGLASIHAKGIVHREVKSYNVLVTSGNYVAIADFGLSRFVQEISSSVKFEGTLNFVSPEQRFEPHTVTPKSDMWSLGMTIYEILSDDLPFRGFSPQEIEEEIQLDDGERHEDPDDLPIELHPLWEKVQECWRVNPNDRPSALEFVAFLETLYEDVLESDGASSGIGDDPVAQDEPIESPTTDDMLDIGQTAKNWRPVVGVEDSKETMALRRAIYTIYNQVRQAKIPINIDAPEFCFENDEWLAHKTTIDAQSPVLQCVVRLPSSFHHVESQSHNRGFNRSRVITGTLKKFGEIKKRYTTRFFHLEGNLLMYYRKAPQLNGATLEENSMASLVMGVTNLFEVSAVHPHESAPWAFELVTTTRTWILAAESEQDYLMWIEAICRLAPFYSINAKYRRMFQLTNPDTTEAQEIRLVLLSSNTVEEALEHIFDHFSSAAKTVARNYKDYALKITGARNYLFDLQQKLCSYQHVRSCVFPKRTLRLTLVLRSELCGPELLKAISLPQSSFDDQINSPSPDIKGKIAKSCDFDIPLRFSINRVLNIPSFVVIMKESTKLLERRPLTHGHCIVTVELFNGGVLIDAPIETNPVRLKPAPGQTLSALWDHLGHMKPNFD